MWEDENGIQQNFQRGISGCPLFLTKEKTVIKVSSSLEYNERLLAQIKKQSDFQKLGQKEIISPLILRVGENEDKVMFEMEYISGNNFLDFLEYSSPNDIDHFVSRIIGYLKFLKNSAKEKYTPEDFKNSCNLKMDSLEKHINQDLFYFIKERIRKGNFYGLEKTFCHGDLTLSNILFNHKSICFLDFLDSYLESWLVDLVKLKQDLFYHWGIIREKNVLSMRSIQVSNYIWDSICQNFKRELGSDEFKILEIINFFRIIPYIKKEKDSETLNKLILKTTIYEEFNNTNGR